MNAVEKRPRRVERFAAGMTATSLHARSLGLFDGSATLGSRGTPIGKYLSTTGLHCYDPFELYAAGVVRDPNMIVWGRLGERKSTLVKVYCRRQHACGRSIRVIDPWGEYGPLAEDLGGTVLHLNPGGRLRLNPLASERDRYELLRSVARSALPRPLLPREPALLNAALDELVRARPDREPTLPRVVQYLMAPTSHMADRLQLARDEIMADARDVAMALRPLCEGDLAGMFDEPTSKGIDLGNRFLSINLRELQNSASLGILLACATAFLQSSIEQQWAARERLGQQPAKTILVVDEAWRIFEVPGVASWLQIQVKQARKLGQQVLLVMHRISDLDAAGDDGSRTAKLVRGLMKDMSTFVLFRLESEELDRTGEVLHMSSSELEVIGDLQPGEALWKVAQRPFVVQTQVTASDLPLTYTDHRMAVG